MIRGCWKLFNLKGGLRPVNERYIETGCGYEACITVSKFPARVEEFWLTRLMNMDNIVCVIDINTEDPNISKKKHKRRYA